MVVSIMLFCALIAFGTMAVVLLTRAALTWVLPADLRRVMFDELITKLSDPSKRDSTDRVAVHRYDDARQPLVEGDFREPAYAVSSVTNKDGYAVFVVSGAAHAAQRDPHEDRATQGSSGFVPSDAKEISDHTIAEILDSEVPDSPAALMAPEDPDPSSASTRQDRSGILDVSMWVDGAIVPKTPTKRFLRLSKARIRVFVAAEKIVRPVLRLLSKVRILNDIVITREEASSAPRRLAIWSTAAVVALIAVAYHIFTAVGGLNIVALTIAPAVAGLLAAGVVFVITSPRTIRARQVAKDGTVRFVAIGKGFWPAASAAAVMGAMAALLVTGSWMFMLWTAAVTFVVAAVVRPLTRKVEERHRNDTHSGVPPTIRLDIRSQLLTAVCIIAAAACAIGL